MLNKQPIKATIIATGKQVINLSCHALDDLKKRLDTSFAAACQTCLTCQGHIIVMGLGKSGHIARKIAATLASTGSPAFFVHPTEAQHGDLGMLTTNDVLIMLSKSGETAEIIALLPALKKLPIPLIAITGNKHSTLAQVANIHLDASVSQEACPLGLAPTTSSTCALVLGDALAISILSQRGFTAADFAKSHPGGILGKRLLLTVQEIMHCEHNLPVITEAASLKTALVEMTQKNLGITTIVDASGTLSGVFTDGDVRRAFDNNASLNDNITTIMTRHPKTIPATLLAADALQLMENANISALIVTDETNKPLGIVCLHRILQSGII
jgi:arabinose-5-phosphate isomerase